MSEKTLSSKLILGFLIALLNSLLLWLIIILLMPTLGEISYSILILAIPFGLIGGYVAGKVTRFSGFLIGLGGGFLGTVIAFAFVHNLTTVGAISTFLGVKFEIIDFFGTIVLGLIFGPLTGVLSGAGATFGVIIQEKHK